MNIERTNWLKATNFNIVLVIYPGTTLWKWHTARNMEFVQACDAPFSVARRFNTVFAAWLESHRVMSMWPNASCVVMEDVA